ncbi:MAG: hypothetical protein AAFQ21_00555 [Pseudomonadota bacterium]
MTTKQKHWGGLGLGLAMATTTLAACGAPASDEPALDAAQDAPPPVTAIAVGEGEGEGGEMGHGMDTLPVEKRVAFMSGHVEAGLALFRAGAPDQAAKHLLHPVSETHEAERAGIDALGFDQVIFIQVSEALEAGLPAEDIVPQLAAAEANMALMQANAGGDPVDIISYLMDTVFEEYRIGVTDGVITDLGEYQDAFGFTVVALNIAGRMDRQDTTGLIGELETLLAMWPEGGPLAESTPTPVTELVAQTSRVHIALGQLD